MRRSDLASRSLFLILVSLPIFCGVLYAFLYSIGLVGFLNKNISFDAWSNLLSGPYFWKSLFFSLYIGIVSVCISVTFAIIVAIRWKKQLQRGPLAKAIYLPLCFPATVMAFYCYQLLAQSGFLSRILFHLRITSEISDFPQLINDGYGIGIIIAVFFLISPFFIILFTQVYRSENLELLTELAASLGANKLQIAAKVTIPVLLNRAAISIVLFVLFVMGNYELPLLLGAQDPQMISMAVLDKLTRYNLLDIPQGYAMSVLYVFLVITVLAISYLKSPRFFKDEKR